ncbi:hypothetical protein HY969_02950 [Candidatus Kaiserbacteria bacterium]|nr:hypothetical protein [Candidatus Kaiserbacteria bacterium]
MDEMKTPRSKTPTERIIATARYEMRHLTLEQQFEKIIESKEEETKTAFPELTPHIEEISNELRKGTYATHEELYSACYAKILSLMRGAGISEEEYHQRVENIMPAGMRRIGKMLHIRLDQDSSEVDIDFIGISDSPQGDLSKLAGAALAFREDLRILADMLRSDPDFKNIKAISATSSILYDRPEFVVRAGFKIVDRNDEFEVSKAIISREDFLKQFPEKKE